MQINMGCQKYSLLPLETWIHISISSQIKFWFWSCLNPSVVFSLKQYVSPNNWFQIAEFEIMKLTMCMCQNICSLSNRVKQNRTEKNKNVSGNFLHRKRDVNLELHCHVYPTVFLLHHCFGISLRKNKQNFYFSFICICMFLF